SSIHNRNLLSFFLQLPQLCSRLSGLTLEVRLVSNAVEIAAPFQAQAFADLSCLIIACRLSNKLGSIKDANIPCDAKVVITETASGIRHDMTRLGPSNCKEFILLLKRSRSPNDFCVDPCVNDRLQE